MVAVSCCRALICGIKGVDELAREVRAADDVICSEAAAPELPRRSSPIYTHCIMMKDGGVFLWQRNREKKKRTGGEESNAAEVGNEPSSFHNLFDDAVFTWKRKKQRRNYQFPKPASEKRTDQLRRGVIALEPLHLVEGATKQTENEPLQVKDLVRIFWEDDEIAEVTREQVQRVHDMHQRMEDGASFSFNYNTLLLVASMLAGLGLVSDSGATVIASMLVSPIMGPVVGLAYGTTINDWKLVRRSFMVEMISLAFCIVVGFVIGGICGPTDLSKDWPTQEMSNRGEVDNLIVGLPIAFFSGLGVAVSLLDNQASSLVGVAISASLLPPGKQ